MRKRKPQPPGAACVMRAVMAAAVRLEIDAWAPQKVASIRVGPGEPRCEGLSVVHCFKRVDPDEPSLRKGTKVWAELPNMAPVTGTLVEVTGQEVAVAFDAEVPTDFRPGRLVEDSRWIQHVLHRSLLSDLSGSRDGLALGLLDLPLRIPAYRGGPVEAPADLNPQQRAVVQQAVRGGVTWVSAGPGTGKTRTISGVAEVLLAQERRTLVVAPSNQAADQAALAVCSRVAGHPDFHNGLVVRLGNPCFPPFLERYGSSTDPFRIALRRLGGADSDPLPAMVREEMDAVIRSARVLVTTTAQPLLVRAMSRQQFDTVILDEAGMTSLPATYCVASLAGRTLLLVGDPLQLKTVHRSAHPVVRTFYGSSGLSVSGSPASIRAHQEAGVGPWLSLSTQYRMDPAIQGLVNDLTYDGRLTAADSVHDRPPLVGPAQGAPLILIDTASLRPAKGGPRGFANPAHAELAGKVVRWLRAGTRDPSHEIVVLARFREQVRAISREVPGESEVAVRTVHRMQGGEADTVVLDLSAAPGSFLGDYLTDVDQDSGGARLLNVALSRARRRVVLLANVPLLFNHPGISEEAVSLRLLEHFIREGIQVDPGQLC